jgi:hypothetical protein
MDMSFTIRDLWLKADIGTTTATKGLAVLVGANGSSFLLKLTPVSGQ